MRGNAFKTNSSQQLILSQKFVSYNSSHIRHIIAKQVEVFASQAQKAKLRNSSYNYLTFDFQSFSLKMHHTV